MKAKVTTVFYLLFCTTVIAGTIFNQNEIKTENKKRDNAIDVSDFSIYYNVHTNETIRKMMPRPWYRPGWRLRLPFTGGPCECEGMKCTCCTGIRIESFDFDRRTCVILKYEPGDATINLEVKMSNNSVYVQMFKAINPPPFCVPIPIPYLPPGLVDMCIRIFDVSIIQQKLHVCMDIDTRIGMAPVLILHFDCMDMGINGVSLSKPGDSNNPSNTVTDMDTMDTLEPTQVNSDVYDPVTEAPNYVTPKAIFKNSISYI
ncbi:unnamed protein product [Parnassius mnemosyne]|uniref:DUF4773 domain-containing protein n=1 Tax=Parnassius mnemosyne TaxID=213953 RepID=A0AAV1M272_9NEOP